MPPEEVFKKVVLVIVIFFAFIILRNLYKTYKFCGINPYCYWKNKGAVLGMTKTILTKDPVTTKYTVENKPDPKTGEYTYPT